MSDPRAYFADLADALTGLLRPGEVFTAWLEGERSDFVRLTRNRVRQAGHVEQLELTLDWIEGRRHATGSLDLSGELDADRPRLEECVTVLRAQRAHLEEDPHLLYATEVRSTETARGDGLPDSERAVREILEAAEGLDLVGLWAAGTIIRAFANSLGQRNWYEGATFHFDWSAYLREDKAAKGGWAGFAWNPEALHAKLRATRQALEQMAREPVTIAPGEYRAYLAPAALQELFTILAWGSFGLKSHRTRQTALIRMITEGRRLHPDFTLWEHHAGGNAPPFTPSGHLKPERVVLIERGAYRDCLTDPRAAREYGQPVNAASEFPQSLDMAPGALPSEEVLARLGRGLYINNLWYANYSDRNACQFTGMTRFACFWVEDGCVVAPINVMRFDDSLYRMLGENLLGITREREFLFESNTYFSRSTASWHLPGVLVEGLRLTI
jgi:predicted Zn-dependent protease